MEELRKLLQYAVELAQLLKKSGKMEIAGVLKALDGQHVSAGPFGSISNKGAAVLPTGKNPYGVDPETLPTRAAWELGVKAAQAILERHLRERGRYPETVGHQLFSLDGFNADGRQLAAILYLFGVRPVWEGDRVVDVEPIPIDELGRPRIDNLVNISGVLRDTLPHYIKIISRAVSKVIQLDEPPELNYPKKHYLEQVSKLGDSATLRVFGPMPGAYGTGIQEVVKGRGWRSREDLAEVWIADFAYGYDEALIGRRAAEALVEQLKTVEVVVKDRYRDEEGPLSLAGDDWFAFLGGFYAAVKYVKGSPPEVLIIDSRDVAKLRLRSLKEEIEREVYGKLLNPEWINGMKKHRHSGAAEIAERIFYLFGWSATTDAVSDEVYNAVASVYFSDEMVSWFREKNPHALIEIGERLLEAAERGLWHAEGEIVEKIKRVYLEVEGELE